MVYCKNCGNILKESAKFCNKCGAPNAEVSHENALKKQEIAGRVFKCPNCGEVLQSFVKNCPACGLELRGIKSTDSVKEFAKKLESIESRREYVPRKSIFSRNADLDQISKTDEQKISLIQNYSIPNTKEDILEFMILASSNINTRIYNNWSYAPTKGETAMNDAWIAKMEQTYEKAKSIFNNEDLGQIVELYNKAHKKISDSKKKALIPHILFYGWMPLALVIIIIFNIVAGPGAQAKEIERMERIEQTAQSALQNQEFKKALLYAEDLVYDPNPNGPDYKELSRQWEIKRELLIDEIIETAKENGIHLERTEEEVEETDSPKGFVEGFKEGYENAKNGKYDSDNN